MRQILDLFWTQFLPSHTHYGMVMNRWNIAENIRTINFHPHSQNLGQKQIFNSQIQGGPEELGKFSYLGQIDLAIA